MSCTEGHQGRAIRRPQSTYDILVEHKDHTLGLEVEAERVLLICQDCGEELAVFTRRLSDGQSL